MDVYGEFNHANCEVPAEETNTGITFFASAPPNKRRRNNSDSRTNEDNPLLGARMMVNSPNVSQQPHGLQLLAKPQVPHSKMQQLAGIENFPILAGAPTLCAPERVQQPSKFINADMMYNPSYGINTRITSAGARNCVACSPCPETIPQSHWHDHMALQSQQIGQNVARFSDQVPSAVYHNIANQRFETLNPMLLRPPAAFDRHLEATCIPNQICQPPPEMLQRKFCGCQCRRVAEYADQLKCFDPNSANSDRTHGQFLSNDNYPGGSPQRSPFHRYSERQSSDEAYLHQESCNPQRFSTGLQQQEELSQWEPQPMQSPPMEIPSQSLLRSKRSFSQDTSADLQSLDLEKSETSEAFQTEPEDTEQPYLMLSKVVYPSSQQQEIGAEHQNLVEARRKIREQGSSQFAKPPWSNRTESKQGWDREETIGTQTSVTGIGSSILWRNPIAENTTVGSKQSFELPGMSESLRKNLVGRKSQTGSDCIKTCLPDSNFSTSSQLEKKPKIRTESGQSCFKRCTKIRKEFKLSLDLTTPSAQSPNKEPESIDNSCMATSQASQPIKDGDPRSVGCSNRSKQAIRQNDQELLKSLTQEDIAQILERLPPGTSLQEVTDALKPNPRSHIIALVANTTNSRTSLAQTHPTMRISGVSNGSLRNSGKNSAIFNPSFPSSAQSGSARQSCRKSEQDPQTSSCSGGIIADPNKRTSGVDFLDAVRSGSKQISVTPVQTATSLAVKPLTECPPNFQRPTSSQGTFESVDICVSTSKVSVLSQMPTGQCSRSNLNQQQRKSSTCLEAKDLLLNAQKLLLHAAQNLVKNQSCMRKSGNQTPAESNSRNPVMSGAAPGATCSSSPAMPSSAPPKRKACTPDPRFQSKIPRKICQNFKANPMPNFYRSAAQRKNSEKLISTLNPSTSKIPATTSIANTCTSLCDCISNIESILEMYKTKCGGLKHMSSGGNLVPPLHQHQQLDHTLHMEPGGAIVVPSRTSGIQQVLNDYTNWKRSFGPNQTAPPHGTTDYHNSLLEPLGAGNGYEAASENFGRYSNPPNLQQLQGKFGVPGFQSPPSQFGYINPSTAPKPASNVYNQQQLLNRQMLSHQNQNLITDTQMLLKQMLSNVRTKQAGGNYEANSTPERALRKFNNGSRDDSSEGGSTRIQYKNPSLTDERLMTQTLLERLLGGEIPEEQLDNLLNNKPMIPPRKTGREIEPTKENTSDPENTKRNSKDSTVRKGNRGSGRQGSALVSAPRLGKNTKKVPSGGRKSKGSTSSDDEEEELAHQRTFSGVGETSNKMASIKNEWGEKRFAFGHENGSGSKDNLPTAVLKSLKDLPQGSSLKLRMTFKETKERGTSKVARKSRNKTGEKETRRASEDTAAKAIIESPPNEKSLVPAPAVVSDTIVSATDIKRSDEPILQELENQSAASDATRNSGNNARTDSPKVSFIAASESEETPITALGTSFPPPEPSKQQSDPNTPPETDCGNWNQMYPMPCSQVPTYNCYSNQSEYCGYYNNVQAFAPHQYPWDTPASVSGGLDVNEDSDYALRTCDTEYREQPDNCGAERKNQIIRSDARNGISFDSTTSDHFLNPWEGSEFDCKYVVSDGSRKGRRWRRRGSRRKRKPVNGKPCECTQCQNLCCPRCPPCYCNNGPKI